MEFASVPIIVTIVFVTMNLLKRTATNCEKFIKYVPIISAGLGAVIGVLCFFFAPEINIADNFLAAFVIGGASGLAATGTSQAIKQLSCKSKVDDTTNEQETTIVDTENSQKDDTTKTD